MEINAGVKKFSTIFMIIMIIVLNSGFKVKTLPGKWTLNKSSPSHVLIYQNSTDSTRFRIEKLVIYKNTISREILNVVILDSDHNECMEILKDSIDLYFKRYEKSFVKYDTLIYKNSKAIKFKNGDPFIDLNVVSFTIDNMFIDARIFIEKKYLKDGCIHYDFIFLNPFVSHSQYNYTYSDGFWIVRYKFSHQLMYHLVSYNDVLYN